MASDRQRRYRIARAFFASITFDGSPAPDAVLNATQSQGPPLLAPLREPPEEQHGRHELAQTPQEHERQQQVQQDGQQELARTQQESQLEQLHEALKQYEQQKQQVKQQLLEPCLPELRPTEHAVRPVPAAAAAIAVTAPLERFSVDPVIAAADGPATTLPNGSRGPTGPSDGSADGVLDAAGAPPCTAEAPAVRPGAADQRRVSMLAPRLDDRPPAITDANAVPSGGQLRTESAPAGQPEHAARRPAAATHRARSVSVGASVSGLLSSGAIAPPVARLASAAGVARSSDSADGERSTAGVPGGRHIRQFAVVPAPVGAQEAGSGAEAGERGAPAGVVDPSSTHGRRRRRSSGSSGDDEPTGALRPSAATPVGPLQVASITDAHRPLHGRLIFVTLQNTPIAISSILPYSVELVQPARRQRIRRLDSISGLESDASDMSLMVPTVLADMQLKVLQLLAHVRLEQAAAREPPTAPSLLENGADSPGPSMGPAADIRDAGAGSSRTASGSDHAAHLAQLQRALTNSEELVREYREGVSFAAFLFPTPPVRLAATAPTGTAALPLTTNDEHRWALRPTASTRPAMTPTIRSSWTTRSCGPASIGR